MLNELDDYLSKLAFGMLTEVYEKLKLNLRIDFSNEDFGDQYSDESWYYLVNRVNLCLLPRLQLPCELKISLFDLSLEDYINGSDSVIGNVFITPLENKFSYNYAFAATYEYFPKRKVLEIENFEIME